MDYIELVEKAKKKDEKAIEKLFELTSQKGYFVALKFLKNKEDAQDILQDAYISALSKLEQLQDSSKFDKWLFQIIANKAKNYLMKNKPLLFEQLDSEEDDSIHFEDTIQEDRLEFQPKENLDYQELKNGLKTLIDDLPEDQRMCLLMYYFEELSISEIANSLELNANTIKSRLSYARNKIKEKIEELQKKGTHLYSVSPIPFMLWMLLEEEKATVVPKVTGAIIQSQIIASSSKAIAKKGITILGKTFSTKVIVSTAVATTALLGGGAGYYNYTLNQEKKAIYDSLKIVFSKEPIFEYGDKFNEQELIEKYTGKIKPLNPINMMKTGKQILKYEVSQSGVERVYEVEVNVEDSKKPMLSLTLEEVEITIGDNFDPKKYIKEAFDEVDGNLLSKVIINNEVNTEKKGEYEVKYSLKDNNGLLSEKICKVKVVEKNIEKVEDKPLVKDEPVVAPTIQNVVLGKMGLNMKIPVNLKSSNMNMSGDTGFFQGSFTSKDSKEYGAEGIAVIIEYFPYTVEFATASEAGGYLYKPREYYLENNFEVRDQGSFLIGYHRGYDGAVMGSAWVMPYVIDGITIHIQDANRNEYVIIVRTAESDKGIYLGVDGFEDKRVEVARQIFNSIG